MWMRAASPGLSAGYDMPVALPCIRLVFMFMLVVIT